MCVCVHAPTDRLVFDGGAGHAKVQLAVLFDASIDQSLHGALILEQQEGVSCRKHSAVIYAAVRKRGGVTMEFSATNTQPAALTAGRESLLKTGWEAMQKNESVITLKQTFGGEIGFALGFMRPVYKQVSKTPETGCYLIWNAACGIQGQLMAFMHSLFWSHRRAPEVKKSKR